MSAHRTLAIVGAGLSGTLVAANLLRSPHGSSTRIVLIERGSSIARGTAYAEREHPYLLNVPAGRMSADPRAPEDFLAFARQSIPTASAEDFLPRALYGRYLEATLRSAESSAPPHVRFETLRADVCGIEHLNGDSAYRLLLADGETLDADVVILALGNPAPAELPGTQELGGRYIADPWARPLDFAPDERVLVVGTGLTTVDVVLAAASSSKEQLVVHCISRHGLVPPSQTQFSNSACKGDSAALLRAASFSARALFRSVRRLAQDTEDRGGDWREAITFVRSIAPSLWQRLPVREKRRLLRHVRPYWDVHRHRLPGQTLERLKALGERGKLHIHAARLLKFEALEDCVRVTFRPRGEAGTRTVRVDRVVNCTGPDYNLRRSRDPLIRSLLAQGLAVADPLNLGIRTASHGALIDSNGHASSNLFYVGPMLRADHWEATAAQELRVHAQRLAAHLCTPVGRVRALATG